MIYIYKKDGASCHDESECENGLALVIANGDERETGEQGRKGRGGDREGQVN